MSSFDASTEAPVMIEDSIDNNDSNLNQDNINNNEDDDLLKCHALVYNSNGSIEYSSKSN